MYKVRPCGHHYDSKINPSSKSNIVLLPSHNPLLRHNGLDSGRRTAAHEEAIVFSGGQFTAVCTITRCKGSPSIIPRKVYHPLESKHKIKNSIEAWSVCPSITPLSHMTQLNPSQMTAIQASTSVGIPLAFSLKQ